MANRALRNEKDSLRQSWEARVEDSLQRSRQSRHHTIFPETIGKMIESEHRQHLLRPSGTFNRSLKTRDVDKIRLAYALHMFTDYSVPKRIQTIWYTGSWHAASANGRLRRTGRSEHENRFLEERLESFFHIGAGRSVHKLLYKDFLSKKETHRFLTCGYNLDYYRCMFWSIARTFTDDDGVALRAARSKLGDCDYHDAFWRDAVRFFVANSIPINEINDLMDFIIDKHTGDPEFTLKGRTVRSLTGLMKVWHRELNIIRRIGHRSWEGLAVKDWTHETNKKDVLTEVWTINQLLTGKELAKEGAAMHHCVSSYDYVCSKGGTGIFSMSIRRGQNDPDRRLTIEVNEHGTIVQVRGFANRDPISEEQKIVALWARQNNLQNKSYY